jgi:hypothetical protein
MGVRASSTRRTQAASAISGQTVDIYTPTGISVSGAKINASSTINLGVVAPGTSASVSTVTVASGPTIANVQYLDSNNAVIVGYIAVSTAGGNILINGTNFVANSNVYINNTLVSNTFISSSQIRAICPAASAGNVNLMIFSPTNVGTITTNGVRYSGVPSWTTAAVSFQNGAAGNVSLVASSDSTLTYTLQAGSTLPTGISLVSAGYLSGTPTGYVANTTGTIVLIATDQEGQATQQTITWTVAVSDPQFNYTTLLLNGDTGNNTANAATNNTFLDSSTNNLTVTRAGSATQGTFSPFSATGWSQYYTPSTTSYLNASITGGLGAGDFTIEGWVMFSVIGSNNGIFQISSGGYLPSNSTNAVALSTYNNLWHLFQGNSGDPSGIGTTPAINQWYHFAMVKSGSTFKTYINGIQIYSAADTTNYTSTTYLSIGAYYSTGYPFSGGSISNFRIVRGTALYSGSNTVTANFTPPTGPLTAIANTVFLGLQSNRLIDNSTNNFAITPTGSISAQAFSPFAPANSYAPATNGGSAYYNGAGTDYTSVANNAAWATLPGDFTVEAWFYLTSLTNSQQIIFTQRSSTTPYVPYLFWTGAASGGTTTITMYSSSNNGSWDIINATTVASGITAGQWYHFAFSRSGSTNRIFLNGTQTYTYTNSSSFSNTGTFNLGLSPGETNTSTQGYVTDARVVKGTALYTAAFTPPTAPLTAVAGTGLLMNMTNGGIVDAHASGDIVTVGSAKLSTATTKFGTASMSFNGTTDYLTNLASTPLYAFGTGDFTVEFWVNFNSTTGRQDLLWLSTTNAATDRMGILWNQVAGNFTYYISPTVAAAISGPATPSTGTWYHIALSRASGSSKLFVNGTQVGSTYSDSRNYSVPYSLYVGRDTNASSSYFSGYLDDIRITKGFARYTANFTPPTSAFQGQ